MSGRRALVTGGSRGIGLAVAGALAERGWRVALVARDASALARARGELAGEGRHEAIALDVANESSWLQRAEHFVEVDGLVCAAGVLDPVGPIGSYSAADFRRTLEVNVVGTMLAIAACLPALRASGGAVVTFSGGGATAPLPRFDAYAASKAAVARLTENIAVELQSEGVRANCIAPGFVATEMHRTTLAAGPELAGENYFERTRAEIERGGVPASDAAELACLLLEHDSDAQFTGKLISAQWDPWRDASFRRQLVEHPDLATIRRIDGVFFGPIGERA